MKVLLHICCGVCSSSVVERLMTEGHVVTGFFYNPNIHPENEYKKRLSVAQKVSEDLNFELIEGAYDRENWFELVRGVQSEPEGGKRCYRCFSMRLKKTYELCSKGMYDMFTTTLTVSPMKDAVVINDIGREIGGEKFMCADFKKRDGFKRAMEYAREEDLYKQHYCGCVYSQEESFRREAEKKKDGE